jgi:hypothetical protein
MGYAVIHVTPKHPNIQLSPNLPLTAQPSAGYVLAVVPGSPTIFVYSGFIELDLEFNMRTIINHQISICSRGVVMGYPSHASVIKV